VRIIIIKTFGLYSEDLVFSLEYLQCLLLYSMENLADILEPRVPPNGQNDQ